MAIAIILTALPARAQTRDVLTDPPQTRAEAIEQQRAEKSARLWPERQSPLVNRVNGLVERGLAQGIDSGQGANGPQLVFGGMRSGQGMTVGLGYRRSDLWRERVSARVTARGTLQGAYFFDADVDFRGVRTERTFIRWYTKLEHSPQIDYYGQGNDSLKENRTSYAYRDVITDLSGGFRPVPSVHLGITGGYLGSHVSAGSDSLPAVREVFPDVSDDPLAQETRYFQVGAFMQADTRDSSEGPRAGRLIGVAYNEYWDIEARDYAFRRADLQFQQFLPYFNRTRVLALGAAAVLTFAKDGNSVPAYLQPTVGGNEELRGYERYRFQDDAALSLTAEHRWHVFSALDMAVFLDAATVAPEWSDLDLADLHYSGGLGLRVRLRAAVVTRIDVAASPEGVRLMWTFSDNFKWRAF